jgi:DNA (cytosine-5)-methyltransferase 1
MRENDRTLGRANEHIRPRYMVWENVAGALSSPGIKNGKDMRGEDFRVVLEETAKIADENAIIPRPSGGAKWSASGCIMGDGWSIAWRVHDAQFWGVPQRRKRIALVADFGGQSAPEILFERKGLSRDIEESAKQREGTTKNIGASIAETISFQERAGCDGGGQRNPHTTRANRSIVNPQQPKCIVFKVTE